MVEPSPLARVINESPKILRDYIAEIETSEIAYLAREVVALRENCAAMEAALADLKERMGYLHDATIVLRNGMGGHNHWDLTMRSGLGCDVCRRQREARQEADRLLDLAKIPP